MNRDDVRKLLGGYATGTLTDAERKVLFEAALADQSLFEELADEQAFKELLETPGARARLLTAVQPAPEKRRQFWWAWGAVGAAAAAGLVLFVVTRSAPEPPVQIAAVEQVKDEQVKEAAAPLAPEPPPPKDIVESRRERAAAPPTAPAVAKEQDALRDVAPRVAAQSVTVTAEAPRLQTEAAEKSAAELKQAANQSPVLQAAAAKGEAAAAGGNVVGGLLPGAPALVLRVNGAPANTAAFSFDYERTTNSLRIMPTAPGVLSVTTGGQALFPQNAVVPGSNVIVPLPPGTGDITISFAASAAAPATQPVRRDTLAGTVADPSPSPGSRLTIVVGP